MADAFGTAATRLPGEGWRVDGYLGRLLGKGQKDSPELRESARGLQEESNGLVTQSLDIDDQRIKFVTEGRQGRLARETNEKEDLLKVRNPSRRPLQQTNGLITQLPSVNDRNSGFVTEGTIPQENNRDASGVPSEANRCLPHSADVFGMAAMHNAGPGQQINKSSDNFGRKNNDKGEVLPEVRRNPQGLLEQPNKCGAQVNRPVNIENNNIWFGQTSAMGKSMPKRQGTIARRGGLFGATPPHQVSRVFSDATDPVGALDIFTPHHLGQKRKFAESLDASSGSDSDESENSSGVQGILGKSLRSSKRLATLMSMREFQANRSGDEEVEDQAETGRSLGRSANHLAGLGSRNLSPITGLSGPPSPISIPAPTPESFLMAPITRTEIECRCVLHPCHPPSKSDKLPAPPIPQRSERIIRCNIKELPKGMKARPMSGSPTDSETMLQGDSEYLPMDDVLETGTQEESFLANTLLTPPFSPQHDISSELEYAQSNSLSPIIPSQIPRSPESPPPFLENVSAMGPPQIQTGWGTSLQERRKGHLLLQNLHPLGPDRQHFLLHLLL